MATGGVATGFALIFLFAAIIMVVGVIGLVMKVGAFIVQGILSPPRSSTRRLGCHLCPVIDCGHENRPGAHYCAQCGVRLAQGGSTQG
jgi:hypothetical protein